MRLNLQFVFFVFFKQKTAYEMLISDWSSDVCSSDLHEDAFRHRQRIQADLDRHLAAVLAQTEEVAAGAHRARVGVRKETVPGEIGRASCRERVCQYV